MLWHFSVILFFISNLEADCASWPLAALEVVKHALAYVAKNTLKATELWKTTRHSSDQE